MFQSLKRDIPLCNHVSDTLHQALPGLVSIAQARHPFMQRWGRRPRVRPLEGFNRSSATSLYATWQASCQRTNRRQGFNRSSATSLYATWENHEQIESYHICFNRSSATSLYATI